MSDETIWVTRSSMPPFEEYVSEIAPLWESHWLTNMGEKHHQLAAGLASYLDVENVTLFTNGHNALECALEALLPAGGKVITTPYSFASTTHAIVRTGHTPVFADISPRTYTIDPASVEALVDDECVGIVAVHVYGNLCDVDGLARVAREHGLPLIYDAAHAFGVRRGVRSAASFGDASMFSFHATKVFNTIEGGAVCYHDASLAPTFDQLKNFGITGTEDVELVGGNAKMNEFCAAMGICNLRHVDGEIEKRRQVSERYWERLGSRVGIRLSLPQEGVTPNYSYLPVVFEDAFGAGRDEVYQALMAQDIHPRKYFYPLISDYACYEGRFDSSATPVAADVSSRVLTLPLYAGLAGKDVDRICNIVLGCGR